MRSPRRWRWSTSVLAVVLAATALPGPAGGAVGDPAGTVDGPAATEVVDAAGGPVAASRTVLLLSGDRVTHTTYADGTTTVTVDPASRPDGRPVAFQTVRVDDGHYVVPVDAFPLLAAGTVDPQLFNVTALVEEAAGGPDRVPVIVTTGTGALAGPVARGVLAVTAPLAEDVRLLPSIGGAGLSLDRDGAGDLWADLTAAAADRPTAALASLSRAKVWLDRTVEVSLSDSVPQIGADEVHDAGLDGTGVTVAVLDTGVDPDHPDLAGRIVQTANFTSDPLRDGHGHGTHVASIIAGSGAASDGTYRGVAPGADLMIGKVLPDSGSGPTSAVIAGMEWAAFGGADIINLSLGGGPSDGSDPASLAVEALTEQTGALFVVAAGNNEGDASVNAPAAASAALAVGNVDKQDQLWFSSNRGPRRGDAAVKPELTAPGTDVVAARSAGTFMGSPVDDRYTRTSGTSMAAPHVAGAAALLAQAHPDWTWQELKDALVSTARPGDYTVFQGGAGRVDVARALDAGVYGPAAANVGAIPAPYDEQRTVPLTYRNHTTEPVTLELALSGQSWHGQDLPAGAVSLSAPSLTVPAGGTATVSLTVDASVGDQGGYAGVVTATAGELTLRTPFSWYKSVGSHKLTVHNLDFRGNPQADEPLWVVKLDGALPNDPFHQVLSSGWSSVDGTTFQVAEGLYDVYGAEVSYWDTHGDRITSTVQTEVRIDEDTEVVLDGRQGVKMDPVTPGPTDLKSASATYHRGVGEMEFGNGFMIGYDPISLYMQPAEYTVGWMEVRELWNLADPLLTTAEVRAGDTTVELTPEYHNFFAGPALAGDRDLELVDAGTGTPAELAAAGVAGKVALVGIPVPADHEVPYTGVWSAAVQATLDAAAAGAAGVLLFTDEPEAKAIFSLRSDPILQLSVPWAEGTQVRSLLAQAAQPVRLVLSGQRDPQRLYHLRYVHEDTSLADAPPVVDPDDLVPVLSRYHTDRQGWIQRMVALAFTPREDAVSGLSYQAWAPMEVTEHILSGSHLRWHREATQIGPPGNFNGETLVTREVFLPGDERDPEEWFQSPMRTGAADVTGRTWAELMCTFCRQGDRFRPGVWYLDTDPRHYNRSLLLEGSSYRLFVGDEEIPNTGSAFVPTFTLRPEPAVYRLEMYGVQPGVPLVRELAPRIDTTWTFRSARPDAGDRPDGYTCPFSGDGGCAFQPLLQLDYQLNLDLLNRAPAGTAHTFRLTVAPHSGTDPRLARPVPLPWVTVWYSTDEGATWREATVRPGRGKNTFLVTVDHPPLAQTSGYVWLRADARDVGGNRVEQTIERAYRLR
ncbi:MAG TPA: S8 family serine peptidase [Natronosporangium sp.]|nr:S8 family serine peptidase [Natronosporangium sp.]